MARQIFQIIACYFIGLVVGNLIFIPYTGPLAPALVLGGALLALPVLLLVVVVFAVARKAILRHLAIWCAVAPLLVVMTWLFVEWETNYSNRGFDVYWYLALKNVRERAALALICGSISSALFWYWNRDRVRPVPAAERELA